MSEIQHSKMDADEYRLPTALIIPLIQVSVVIFLFMALLNGQRDLTVMGIMALTIMVGTKIWSRLSPANIYHSAKLDKQRAFPGEALIFSTRIRNAKILPVLAQLSVSFSKDFQSADSPGLIKRCSLLWYQETNFKWRLTALRRGVHRIGLAELAIGDLFGFYSRTPEPAEALDVIVYPRLIPLKPVPLPRRDFFGIPAAKSPIEDPVYVFGTREYQSGRPARYIHWKASARLGRLQEKICEPAAQEKILLMVDVTGFADFRAHTEFEKILEVAASAAVHFDRLSCAVGLVTNGGLEGGGSPILPIGRGRQQIPKILETLARLQMTPSADLGDILRRGPTLSWGTTAVSLSYDGGGSGKAGFAGVNHGRQPVVSIVCRLNSQPGADQGGQPADILTLEDICMESG